MRDKISIVCLIASCGSAETTPTSKQATAPAPASKIVHDARSSVDFAAEWAKIAATTNEEQKRIQALTMIERWEGRTFEWDAYALASLCQSEERCAVNIVERNKLPVPDLLGGFFPMLQLTTDGMRTLRQGCKGKTGCVIRFSGELQALRTDPEFPLGMSFVSVNVLTTRDATPDEQWWRDKPGFEVPADYKPSTISLANPNEPPLPPIKIKTQEPVF